MRNHQPFCFEYNNDDCDMQVQLEILIVGIELSNFPSLSQFRLL